MINSRVITNNKNGAEISFSPYMDIFHSGEDEIGLEWNGQAQQAGFQRMADGTWHLEWVMNSGAPSFNYMAKGFLFISPSFL